MRAGLVGDDVDGSVLGKKLGEDLCCVTNDADGQRLLSVASLNCQLKGVVEVVCLDVEVAVLDAAVDARFVNIHGDDNTVVHGNCQRLCAAHTAETSGEGDGACEGSVKALASNSAEGFIGALQDALGADVDP